MRHWNIMVRFEESLEACLESPLQMAGLCDAIGVPERTLRICSAEILGMGPSRYLQLRRLHRVRAVLQRAAPTAAIVGEIARRFGFSELGRFAAAYRAVFGEAPSATLRRSRARDAVSAESA
jgi:transcriptional regulator GlxA family with amidase domain